MDNLKDYLGRLIEKGLVLGSDKIGLFKLADKLDNFINDHGTNYDNDKNDPPEGWTSPSNKRFLKSPKTIQVRSIKNLSKLLKDICYKHNLLTSEIIESNLNYYEYSSHLSSIEQDANYEFEKDIRNSGLFRCFDLDTRFIYSNKRIRPYIYKVSVVFIDQDFYRLVKYGKINYNKVFDPILDI